MLKDTDLYIIACIIQQRCIDEYDEEMIDNIFEDLKRRKENGELGTLQTFSISR